MIHCQRNGCDEISTQTSSFGGQHACLCAACFVEAANNETLREAGAVFEHAADDLRWTLARAHAGWADKGTHSERRQEYDVARATLREREKACAAAFVTWLETPAPVRPARPIGLDARGLPLWTPDKVKAIHPHLDDESAKMVAALMPSVARMGIAEPLTATEEALARDAARRNFAPKPVDLVGRLTENMLEHEELAEKLSGPDYQTALTRAREALKLGGRVGRILERDYDGRPFPLGIDLERQQRAVVDELNQEELEATRARATLAVVAEAAGAAGVPAAVEAVAIAPVCPMCNALAAMTGPLCDEHEAQTELAAMNAERST